MKLAFFCSPSDSILRDEVFLPTLCEPWELIELRVETQAPGDLGSRNVFDALKLRSQCALGVLRQFPDEIIVFSDVGTQWFQPAMDTIRCALREMDVVFQRENPEAAEFNFGFFAAHSNVRTELLLAGVLAAADQLADGRLTAGGLFRRARPPCRWGFLPDTFVCDGVLSPPRAQWILYHSTPMFPRCGGESVELMLERHRRAAATADSPGAAGPPALDGDYAARPEPAGHACTSCRYNPEGTIAYSAIDSASGCVLAPNIIIHPRGMLYGDLSGVRSDAWRRSGESLEFLHRGNQSVCWQPVAGYWVSTGSNMRSSGRLRQGLRRRAAVPGGDGGDGKLVLRPQVELPTGEGAFEIVVAHYREDIAWTDAYAPNVTVYEKYPGRPGALPNFGREANTYLHHIAANYDRLARRTLFLQGDPFAHRLLPIPDYFADPRPFACGRLYDFFIESVPWWTAAGQEINAGVMREFLEIIECDPNLRRFEFTAGAQFALPREVILRRPRSYYQRLAAFTAQESVMIAGRRFDDRHVAFLFEIFWRNVFQLDESTGPSIPG